MSRIKSDLEKRFTIIGARPLLKLGLTLGSELRLVVSKVERLIGVSRKLLFERSEASHLILLRWLDISRYPIPVQEYS